MKHRIHKIFTVIDQKTYTTEIYILILSAMSSFTISLFTTSLDLIGKEKYNLPEIFTNIVSSSVLLTLLAFASIELLRILHHLHGVKDSFDIIADVVHNTKIQNDTHNSITQTILKIFEHDDENIRNAIVPSFKEFLKLIKISGDYVNLDGNFIAVQVYNNFWKLISDKQEEYVKHGKHIRVYVTHSSAIRIWLSSESSAMKGIQRHFIDNGGEIYRIVIKNRSSHDDYDSYCLAIKNMREMNMKAFFVDATDSVPLIHEYLMVVIDGNYYVLIWRATWDAEGLFGNIVGCKIYIGKYKFDEYWFRWKDLVHELEHYNRTQIMHDDRYSQTLLEKPTQDLLEKMLTLT